MNRVQKSVGHQHCQTGITCNIIISIVDIGKQINLLYNIQNFMHANK
jgi:hypothetical protein